MNLALWITAGLPALGPLTSGSIKVFVPLQKVSRQEATAWTRDASPVFVKSLGMLEIMASVGLILAGLVDIAPRHGADHGEVLGGADDRRHDHPRPSRPMEPGAGHPGKSCDRCPDCSWSLRTRVVQSLKSERCVGSVEPTHEKHPAIRS